MKVPGCQSTKVPRYQGSKVPGCQHAKVPRYQGTTIPNNLTKNQFTKELGTKERRHFGTLQLWHFGLIGNCFSEWKIHLEYLRINFLKTVKEFLQCITKVVSYNSREKTILQFHETPPNFVKLPPMFKELPPYGNNRRVKFD